MADKVLRFACKLVISAVLLGGLFWLLQTTRRDWLSIATDIGIAWFVFWMFGNLVYPSRWVDWFPDHKDDESESVDDIGPSAYPTAPLQTSLGR